jgi:hypothetical protein
MCRVLAIVLMLLVPLEFAWSAAQRLHHPLGSDVASLGFHTHAGESDHPDGGKHATQGEPGADRGNSSDSNHGHSGGHYHPIFVSLVSDAELILHETLSGGAPVRALATYTSRTPPLFDWPPAARS